MVHVLKMSHGKVHCQTFPVESAIHPLWALEIPSDKCEGLFCISHLLSEDGSTVI